MDKILGTFYKGNSNTFGLGSWNSVKDDFIEVSKSQNIRPLSINNPINEPSSVYNQEYNNNSRYNHFSPNLIRMQYFNDSIKEIEHRRNLYLQDYLINAKYNVYYDQYNPLMDRRKNVQIRLGKIKNKLLNDEEKKLIRKQKKIEEENRIIDNLIYENEQKEDDDLFRMLDNKEKNLNNNNSEINEEESKSKSEYLSNDYSYKNSILILSRTSTNENDSYDDFNLLSMDENESMVNTNKSFYSTKGNKTKKRKSVQRNSISQNKKKHTDILSVMMNVEKYSKPIDNTNYELADQHRHVGDICNGFIQDIKDYKKEFQEKISRLNEKTENNINTFKEILMMSDNKNIKNSLENVFLRNGKNKLKIDKNYLDSESIQFKNDVDINLQNAFDDYLKQRITQDYEKRLQNEPKYMENDYNYRIKQNERSRYGLANIRNLYNKIDKLQDIEIKPTNLEEESVSFSPSNSVKSDMFTFSNNSKSNIFPALRGLKEKYTTGVLSEKSEKKIDKIVEEDGDKKIKTKKKKKKAKDVYVKDLGTVPEEYEEYKDNKGSKRGRKETILNFRNDNELKMSKKTLVNLNSSDKKEKNKENNQQNNKSINKSDNQIGNKNSEFKNSSENESRNKKDSKNKSNKSQKSNEMINIIKEENEEDDNNKESKKEEQIEEN